MTIGDSAFYEFSTTELSNAEGIIVDEYTFNFDKVECFSMPELIMYFSRQLIFSLSELFEIL